MNNFVNVTKKHASKVGVGALTLLGSAAAMASEASPSEGVAAINSLSTQVTDLLAAAWPIATAIVGGMIGIKLFKKFANRAS